MQVTVDWNAVVAMIGVAGAAVASNRFMIRSIVRDENAKQLEKINGTYVRSMGSKITGHEIERRLDAAGV